MKVKRSFDREYISEYEVIIVVIDFGFFFFIVIIIVFVLVIDVNDNVLFFKVLYFQFFVLENMLVGMKVGQLSVIDKDVGVNGNLLFFVIEGYKNIILFIVF